MELSSSPKKRKQNDPHAERGDRFVKSLQTLTAESLLKQVNPAYHPLLLRTLLQDLNLGNHLHTTMIQLHREQQEIVSFLAERVRTGNDLNPLPDTVLCEECGNDSVAVTYEDFDNGDEITAPGTILLRGDTGAALMAALKRCNRMLKMLEQYFIKITKE